MFQHSLNEADQLPDQWPALRKSERLNRFESLPREQMDNFFLDLDAKSQSELVLALPEGVRRLYIRLLAPDDAVDALVWCFHHLCRVTKLKNDANHFFCVLSECFQRSTIVRSRLDKLPLQAVLDEVARSPLDSMSGFVTTSPQIVYFASCVKCLRYSLLAREIGQTSDGYSFYPMSFVTYSLSVGIREPVSHTKSRRGYGGRRTPSELSFHSLRHTAVSLLKDAGIPQQELVGHESVQMSQQYTHVGIDALQKAAAALPEL